MFEPKAIQSLCPVCLRRLGGECGSAEYRETAPGIVELIKTCPEHGTFRAPVWRGEPFMETWRRPKTPSFPRQPLTNLERGCPFDCGLCPEHGQHTCTGQIEVTECCDLGCPVCYAGSGDKPKADPPLSLVEFQLDRLWQASGACNVQFSGGEPTMRDDLPVMVAAARRRGFALVQVNSNGLRLGREPAYARALADAGLDSVYLQFDGATDDIYRTIRGRACLADKLAAVRNCAEAGLGVVLVGTVVRGVNLEKLGDLLRLAVDLGPSVRGLHVQPAASFGRYPWHIEDAPRVTLPEIMRALAEQGALSVTDFHPPGCENALCSFSAVYRRDPEGLVLLEGESHCCDSSSRPSRLTEQARTAEEGARLSKAFTARHWSAPPAAPSACGDMGAAGVTTGEVAADVSEMRNPGAGFAGDDFDRFLARAGLAKRFTVSAMAFQDAMTLDVERVRGCCIHVVTPDGLLVPFCLHNLTSVDGTTLYREKKRS